MLCTTATNTSNTIRTQTGADLLNASLLLVTSEMLLCSISNRRNRNSCMVMSELKDVTA